MKTLKLNDAIKICKVGALGLYTKEEFINGLVLDNEPTSKIKELISLLVNQGNEFINQ